MAARPVIEGREARQHDSELVATVSHELRTPLASVLGFVELLLDRDLDEHTRRRYLGIIHCEAQRLATLVDDFLDLEKIEAGRLTLALEPFNLGDLLRHEIELFSAQSASHTLELAGADEAIASIGDRNRIGQVIANLLSNAIKYSPGGGAVRVTATPGEGFARIQVSDSGLGIPVAQQDQVFTKFFRVDSSDTRDIGGTGLGLALCQEIVTAHGGRIGFTSAEGEGSTFWFELPTAWLGGAPKQSKRMLVIGSDPELALRIADRLAGRGLEIESVETGEDALTRALDAPPALICLDGDLTGDLDGWQVLVRLKANPAMTHIPVVVCADARGRSVATTLGAAAFLRKPFTLDQLCEVSEQQLSVERPSFLIVGGDQTLRRLVVETLARDGGELREAADDMEAISMIDQQRPDALVLDLTLPESAGFAAIEQMLGRPELSGTPVVVLTGRDLSVAERRFLRERNASLLPKSAYSGDQLRRLLHHPRFASSRFALLDVQDAPAEANPTGSFRRASVDAEANGRPPVGPTPRRPGSRSHAD